MIVSTFMQVAIDTLDGRHLESASLTIRSRTKLNCGCWRLTADRPGGGEVHLFEGTRPHAHGIDVAA